MLGSPRAPRSSLPGGGWMIHARRGCPRRGLSAVVAQARIAVTDCCLTLCGRDLAKRPLLRCEGEGCGGAERTRSHTRLVWRRGGIGGHARAAFGGKAAVCASAGCQRAGVKLGLHGGSHGSYSLSQRAGVKLGLHGGSHGSYCLTRVLRGTLKRLPGGPPAADARM